MHHRHGTHFSTYVITYALIALVWGSAAARTYAQIVFVCGFAVLAAFACWIAYLYVML